MIFKNWPFKYFILHKIIWEICYLKKQKKINNLEKWLKCYGKHINKHCRVTNCSLNPKGLGYRPSKPNTINL